VLVHFDDVAAVFVRADLADAVEPLDEEAEFAASLKRVREALPAPRPWREAGWLGRVDSPWPYLAVADFLLACRRPDDAAPFVDDAAAAYPASAGLALRQATVRELRGDFHGAVEAAEAGLERAGDDARLQVKLGEAHYNLKRLDDARTWLERSLGGLPQRARTWALLGSIDAARGAYDEAARRLERAVALAPQEPEFLAALARVEARRGRRDEAIRGLEAALARAPRDLSLYRDLALLHAAAGDLEAARRDLARGLAIAPDDPGLQRAAATLRGGS
jgi:tetratricopeptide (TPR) repeat protein